MRRPLLMVDRGRGENQGYAMNFRKIRCLPIILVGLLVSGCKTGLADGDYVAFVRDVMVESARLDEASGDGPERMEPVERAVREWRGADQDSASPGSPSN